jgi:transcription-repair coupling factor (superfamily II helicase)
MSMRLSSNPPAEFFSTRPAARSSTSDPLGSVARRQSRPADRRRRRPLSRSGAGDCARQSDRGAAGDRTAGLWRGGFGSILAFPDWETLPYDVFSPHQDIVSQRLAALYRLPQQRRGVLVAPVATLMQRLAPRDYLDRYALLLKVGERLHLEPFRQRLEASGYVCVSQVVEHGEFAVRGSILDLFPMGGERPYRIELFDDEVESIRDFDPDTQLSIAKAAQIELLPAREFALDKDTINRFGSPGGASSRAIRNAVRSTAR